MSSGGLMGISDHGCEDQDQTQMKCRFSESTVLTTCPLLSNHVRSRKSLSALSNNDVISHLLVLLVQYFSCEVTETVRHLGSRSRLFLGHLRSNACVLGWAHETSQADNLTGSGEAAQTVSTDRNQTQGLFLTQNRKPHVRKLGTSSTQIYCEFKMQFSKI